MVALDNAVAATRGVFVNATKAQQTVFVDILSGHVSAIPASGITDIQRSSLQTVVDARVNLRTIAGNNQLSFTEDVPFQQFVTSVSSMTDITIQGVRGSSTDTGMSSTRETIGNIGRNVSNAANNVLNGIKGLFSETKTQQAAQTQQETQRTNQTTGQSIAERTWNGIREFVRPAAKTEQTYLSKLRNNVKDSTDAIEQFDQRIQDLNNNLKSAQEEKAQLESETSALENFRNARTESKKESSPKELAPGITHVTDNTYTNTTGKNLVVYDPTTGKRSIWENGKNLQLSDSVIVVTESSWIWLTPSNEVKVFALQRSQKSQQNAESAFLDFGREARKDPQGKDVYNPQKAGTFSSYDITESGRVLFTLHRSDVIPLRDQNLTETAIFMSVAMMRTENLLDMQNGNGKTTEILMVPRAACERGGFASGQDIRTKNENFILMTPKTSVTELTGITSHEYTHELLGSSPIADFTEGIATLIGALVSPDSINMQALHKIPNKNILDIVASGTSISSTQMLPRYGQTQYENTYTIGGFIMKAILETQGSTGISKILRAYVLSQDGYRLGGYGYDLALQTRQGQNISNHDAIKNILNTVLGQEATQTVMEKAASDLGSSKKHELRIDRDIIQTVMIGREFIGNDIVLDANNTHLSRKHAIITVNTNGEVRIYDNQPTNGTYVNNKPADAQDGLMLTDGDTITLGTLGDPQAVTFRFQKQDAGFVLLDAANHALTGKNGSELVIGKQSAGTSADYQDELDFSTQLSVNTERLTKVTALVTRLTDRLAATQKELDDERITLNNARELLKAQEELSIVSAALRSQGIETGPVIIRNISDLAITFTRLVSDIIRRNQNDFTVLERIRDAFIRAIPPAGIIRSSMDINDIRQQFNKVITEAQRLQAKAQEEAKAQAEAEAEAAKKAAEKQAAEKSVTKPTGPGFRQKVSDLVSNASILNILNTVSTRFTALFRPNLEYQVEEYFYGVTDMNSELFKDIEAWRMQTGRQVPKLDGNGKQIGTETEDEFASRRREYEDAMDVWDNAPDDVLAAIAKTHFKGVTDANLDKYILDNINTYSSKGEDVESTPTTETPKQTTTNKQSLLPDGVTVEFVGSSKRFGGLTGKGIQPIHAVIARKGQMVAIASADPSKGAVRVNGVEADAGGILLSAGDIVEIGDLTLAVTEKNGAIGFTDDEGTPVRVKGNTNYQADTAERAAAYAGIAAGLRARAIGAGMGAAAGVWLGGLPTVIGIVIGQLPAVYNRTSVPLMLWQQTRNAPKTPLFSADIFTTEPTVPSEAETLQSIEPAKAEEQPIQTETEAAPVVPVKPASESPVASTVTTPLPKDITLHKGIDYELTEKLSGGGGRDAAVFKGIYNGKTVAIKVFPNNRQYGPDRGMEYSILISSKGVLYPQPIAQIQIVDPLGNEYPAYVMEYIDGQTLGLYKGTLPDAVIQNALSKLQNQIDRGLKRGDIKTDNIIVVQDANGKATGIRLIDPLPMAADAKDPVGTLRGILENYAEPARTIQEEQTVKKSTTKTTEATTKTITQEPVKTNARLIALPKWMQNIKSTQLAKSILNVLDKGIALGHKTWYSRILNATPIGFDRPEAVGIGQNIFETTAWYVTRLSPIVPIFIRIPLLVYDAARFARTAYIQPELVTPMLVRGALAGIISVVGGMVIAPLIAPVLLPAGNLIKMVQQFLGPGNAFIYNLTNLLFSITNPKNVVTFLAFTTIFQFHPLAGISQAIINRLPAVIPVTRTAKPESRPVSGSLLSNVWNNISTRFSGAIYVFRSAITGAMTTFSATR